MPDEDTPLDLDQVGQFLRTLSLAQNPTVHQCGEPLEDTDLHCGRDADHEGLCARMGRWPFTEAGGVGLIAWSPERGTRRFVGLSRLAQTQLRELNDVHEP